MFGLDVDTLRELRQAFAKFPRIEKALIYGSRAKGNYKKGSDIDITLVGKNLTLENATYPLANDLDDLYLPYKFDISIFNQLDDSDFIDHILRVGKTFYQKENNARKGWKETTIGDVCEFRNGLWKGKKPPFVHVGVIRNTNFTKSGFLDDSNIAYLDVEEKQFAKRQLQFGDLILERSGGGPKQPVGRVIIFDKTEGLFSFSNFTSIIRVIDPMKLSFRFLHHVLCWHYISGMTEGMQRRSTGIRNLDFTAYKQLPIPLPSLAEQKRIVAILDEAFAAIATATENTKKNLANAQELFDSALHSVFQPPQSAEDSVSDVTARTVKIMDVVEPLTTTDPRKQPEESFEYIDVSSVSRITHSIRTTSPTLGCDAPSRAKRLVRAGDVLFATIRPTLQRIAIVPAHLDQAICSTGYFVLRPKPDVNNRFLFYYLFSQPFSDEMALLQRGASYPAVSDRDVKEHLIHLPPLPEQNRIATFLDKLSAEKQTLVETYKTKIRALAELKQSMLHQAFIGELTADKNTFERTLIKADA